MEKGGEGEGRGAGDCYANQSCKTIVVLPDISLEVSCVRNKRSGEGGERQRGEIRPLTMGRRRVSDLGLFEDQAVEKRPETWG